MIEDPWADLLRQKDINYQNYDDTSADASLSDSLMPQVGDSIINPAPDVPDTLDQSYNTEDLSKYSFNSDKGSMPIG